MTKYDNPKKLHINERLTCRLELDDKVFTFDEKIIGLDSGGILIGEPDVGEKSIQIGQSVLVRYYRPDSAYQFISKILDIVEKGSKFLFRLSFPAQITRYQRRIAARVDMEGTVVVRKSGEESTPLRGFLLNISTGGVLCSLPQVRFLRGKVSLVGVQIKIDLTLSTGEQLSNIEASIRRTSLDPGRKTHIQIHLSFDKVTGNQGAILMKLIRKHQKE
ncbi:MAG: PilZ domain-containing protein [Candidatus Electryonea clarkiae]|nr:PilZ domain-containing protein [Candidatus Electryonea clarkiae]MDP8285225.1 PilZ domain-containing protein [Candidatus Electryonea clarkiae]